VVKSSHFQNTRDSWALIFFNFLFFLPNVIITIYLIGREVDALPSHGVKPT